MENERHILHIKQFITLSMNCRKWNNENRKDANIRFSLKTIRYGSFILDPVTATTASSRSNNPLSHSVDKLQGVQFPLLNLENLIK